jgi:hypothetical protein
VKSAVEMTPRGKRGKLKKPKRVSHSFHRAWKSGQKPKAPDFHISTAPAAALSYWGRTKDEGKTKFQLTESDPFKQDRNASVASLRP